MKLGFTLTVEITILLMSLIAGLFCSVFYNNQLNMINTFAKIDNN